MMYQDALLEGCRYYGLQEDVKIIDLKPERRLILSYDQNPDRPHFANAMIKLERWMKVYTGDTAIELMCESLEDKNKRDVKSGRIEAKMISARNVESLG